MNKRLVGSIIESTTGLLGIVAVGVLAIGYATADDKASRLELDLAIKEEQVYEMQQTIERLELEIATSDKMLNTAVSEYDYMKDMYETETGKEVTTVITTGGETVYNKHNYHQKDLTVYDEMTVNDLNEWIADRAPDDSPFIGKADMFIQASDKAGLDPKYIVAHAALESGWGTSDIFKAKNNYFGIEAYNHDPFNSAKSFSDGVEGLIEGVLWIRDYYIKEGQNTLDKMINGKKAYAMEYNGEGVLVPDQTWITKIVSIIHK